MISSSSVVPLPDSLFGRLGPPLARLGAGASDYLHGCAAALLARRTTRTRFSLRGR
jgi:hypothetical protein